MRGLLYLILLAVVVVAITRMLPAWRQGMAPRRSQRDELVKDPVCQTYVLLSRAVTARAGDGVAYFCSRECAARFAAGERSR